MSFLGRLPAKLVAYVQEEERVGKVSKRDLVWAAAAGSTISLSGTVSVLPQHALLFPLHTHKLLFPHAFLICSGSGHWLQQQAFDAAASLLRWQLGNGYRSTVCALLAADLQQQDNVHPVINSRIIFDHK